MAGNLAVTTIQMLVGRSVDVPSRADWRAENRKVGGASTRDGLEY